jgi:excinuclease UvrABC helicase subunit UvrB
MHCEPCQPFTRLLHGIAPHLADVATCETNRKRRHATRVNSEHERKPKKTKKRSHATVEQTYATSANRANNITSIAFG